MPDTEPNLKAPFTYFGGKSKIAPDVWSRFGDVKHYIEPFFGSGAVLLARPATHSLATNIETVNDLDGNVANVWRSLKAHPTLTAQYAAEPVNECDMHAKHLWLTNTGKQRAERLMADPEWCDPKAAGWWIWGTCCWIGSGFCSGKGAWTEEDGRFVKKTDTDTLGVTKQLPKLSGYGSGVNSSKMRPEKAIFNHFLDLTERLRHVRVACGDWSRITKPSVLPAGGGITGVFLDPPYTEGSDRHMGVYQHDGGDVGHDVYKWAMENGDNPDLRIALCGYEGEYTIPDTWEEFSWKARGGFGVQGEGRGRANSSREKIWFSPHCSRERV